MRSMLLPWGRTLHHPLEGTLGSLAGCMRKLFWRLCVGFQTPFLPSPRRVLLGREEGKSFGLHATDGWDFLEVVHLCLLGKPLACVFECSDDVDKHAHFAHVKHALATAGFTLVVSQNVTAHELTNNLRTRWFCIWLRNDVARFHGMLPPTSSSSHHVWKRRWHWMTSCKKFMVTAAFYLWDPRKEEARYSASPSYVVCLLREPAPPPCGTFAVSWAIHLPHFWEREVVLRFALHLCFTYAHNNWTCPTTSSSSSRSLEMRSLFLRLPICSLLCFKYLPFPRLIQVLRLVRYGIFVWLLTTPLSSSMRIESSLFGTRLLLIIASYTLDRWMAYSLQPTLFISMMERGKRTCQSCLATCPWALSSRNCPSRPIWESSLPSSTRTTLNSIGSYLFMILPLDWAIQLWATSWLLYRLTELFNDELPLDYSTTWLSYSIVSCLLITLPLDWAIQLWATSWLLYHLTELSNCL